MDERYQILEDFQSQGGRSICRAYDLVLKQEVAIKRLPKPSGVEQGQAVPSLTSFRHPHVVEALDAGIDQDGPYVVMEMVSGEDLDQIVGHGVGRQPLPLDDFRLLARQCLEAFVAAADLDLIHGGINPANIILTRLVDGGLCAKLLDFELAKKATQSESQAKEDLVTGNVYFLAPEQFHRLPLDLRADLYSLGCTLYYAISGAYPFKGESAEAIMVAHLHGNCRPLEERRPDLSPDLIVWMHRMMAVDRDERPSSAAAALLEFDAIQWDRTLSASFANALAASTASVKISRATTAVNQASTATSLTPARPVIPSSIVPAVRAEPFEAEPMPEASSKLDSSATQDSKGRKNFGPILFIMAGGALLILMFILIWKPGKSQTSASTTSEPVLESSTNTSKGGVEYPSIQDALQVAAVTRHERAYTPHTTNLTAHFMSKDWVQTYKADSSDKDVAAGPGDKVSIWKDRTELAGQFNLAGDKNKPEFLPTLNVVRIEPSGLEHPVVTFHHSEWLAGRIPSDAKKYPFDPLLKDTGITVIQALRCRPVASLDIRTVRIATGTSNQNIVSIQMAPDGSFKASLGQKHLSVPAVMGEPDRFCIVTCLWDADDGHAQLFCRTADGVTREGAETRKVPQERDAAERVQIGDAVASESKGGYKFNGDILDTLIYNRALNGAEHVRVEKWLADYFFGKP
jgi:serine/threonine protein kinase